MSARLTLATLSAGTVTLLVPVVQVQAAPTPLNLTKCLQLTTTTALRTSAILDGLGLTSDQVRELRSRLSSFNSVRGFEGLDGIGLTPDQIREIQRRINAQVAAMNRYPLGWPCKPFKNGPLVVKFLKDKLVPNGFRPNMRFVKKSPRQYQFQGVQDGIRYIGAVVKSGDLQIAVALTSLDDQWGRTYKYNLKFET